MTRRFRRPGIILPVVLVLIGLLALLTAGFTFFTRAEIAGSNATAGARQARLAADSGLEEVTSMIRLGRDDVTIWQNNPTRLRHALVWSDAFDREGDPVRLLGSRLDMFEEGQPAIAFRFCIVAMNLDDPNNESIRYGITAESSKLNINVATDQQIEQLLTPILAALEIENAQELINALLDWRDADDELREGGAENEYYNTLEPPYRAKNGPLDTVEEILIVQGFNAAILYGEDVNRNGVLDANENDGDESYPFYDNSDGRLDFGIAPFLTVWTREPDTSLDNKPRINLTADAAVVQAQFAALEEDDPLTPEAIEFIQSLISQNFNFTQIRSPAELYAGDQDDDDGGGNSTIPAQLRDSPLTLEDMPGIMDRCSVVPVQQAAQGLSGLININTAPRQVLALIPGMPAEAIELIIGTRKALESEALSTTAWPLTTGTLEAAAFKQIAPFITTKSYQFHVEALGYADHIKLMRRYEWIIEMVGPLAQVKYHRDLTRLGLAWPIDDDNFLISTGR